VLLAGEDGPRLVLAPIILNEVLDAVPDIAYQEFSFARPLGLKSIVGSPKWRLSTVPSGGLLCADLMIELCWSPLMYPAACARLRERLTEQIFNAAPAFFDAVSSGDITFKITFYEPRSSNLKTMI
jgi:hypothetical protein